MSRPVSEECGIAAYHLDEHARRACVWATWAIMQLPEPMRGRAARAWRAGKYPIDLKPKKEMGDEVPCEADDSGRAGVGG